MKPASSFTISGITNNFGIPLVAITAACSLTLVLAWSTALGYRHNASSSLRRASFHSRMWWQRLIADSKTGRSLQLSARSNSNDENHDSNIEPSTFTDKTQKNNRFTTVEDTMIADGGILRVHPIGTVRSIYRLCVGTPRQGMLAPHALARIELHNLHDDRTGVEAAATVDGLLDFSHVWIVFVFHLNTIGKRKHSKIAPPALGGTRKVGVLATRSPHRLNPIGMTLAKLDGIRTIPSSRNEDGRKLGAITVLDISGCDLVDGTPVLDIKPYVPFYDTVPLNDSIVPDWVTDGLSTARTVQFTESSIKELQNIVYNHPESLEFYGKNSTSVISKHQMFESIKACIKEVLAVDVRSQHQTNKARLGQSRAENAVRVQQQTVTIANVSHDKVICTQQLDNLLVSFTVLEATFTERKESGGSGAEDVVTVESILLR